MRIRQNRAASHATDSENIQRKRVLMGMLAAINDHGYAGATVAQVITRAGVSRQTFYDCFTDKDDCFLALYREVSSQLIEQISRVVTDSPPERALHATVRKLIEHAEAEPAKAQFLAGDALSAGRPVRYEREQMIGQISTQVRAAGAVAPPRARSPDLPTLAVIGATHALVLQRLRLGEREHRQLSDGLTDWLKRYEQPIGNHRWSTLSPGPMPEASPHLSGVADELPVPALSATSPPFAREPAQSDRWHILFAAAERAAQTGYDVTTVAAITADARVNKRVFYRHFRNKRQVFLALHELAFQQSIAVGATAYFSFQRWPERVWRCLLATSQFHAAHPTVAHVGFIETQALGPLAVQRVEDARHAFATLLRADSHNADLRQDVTSAEATSAAIFEIARDRILHRHARELPRYAYHATYAALAPFLGVRAADRFVRTKLKHAL